ncbi:MAG TPA: gamma-glutamylcyclotransferase family protein, partial [Blastocatellia bacterium]|nr:gamma-glutamylcyclotransferase family protein [Blastocatellia bacterium]
LPDEGEMLSPLDTYEGFDARYPESSLFVRRKCKVAFKDDSKLVCWIYVYNWQVSPETLIRGGDYLWHQKLKSLRRRPE